MDAILERADEFFGRGRPPRRTRAFGYFVSLDLGVVQPSAQFLHSERIAAASRTPKRLILDPRFDESHPGVWRTDRGTGDDLATRKHVLGESAARAHE